MSETSGRRRVFARELLLGDERRTDRFLARETPGNVGVALSGGGSRACVAAYGQLQGLRALGHLGAVRAISAVSGGSWVSSAYTFLPDDRRDDDFFGPVIAAPEELRARGDRPEGIDAVPERSFVHAITTAAFGPGGLAAATHRAAERGVPPGLGWGHVVGEVLLGPQGLYHVDAGGRPTAFFAADEDAVADARRANPGALPERALTVHRATGDAPRPFLIVNTALRVFEGDAPIGAAPVQGTPWFVGVVARPDAVDRRGEPIGGGGVPPYAFGGRLVGVRPGSPRIVEVEGPALFGLHDLVGASSAFLADKAIRGSVTEPLVPEYERYRPGAPAPAGGPDHFLDGGALENTGVAALLAWQDIERLLIFVNAPKPLRLADDGSGVPVVERQVPPLFGYRPYEEGVGYRPYAGVEAPVIGPGEARGPRLPRPFGGRDDAVIEAFKRNAVFAAADFKGLLDGLLARASAGTAAPGVGPSAHLQRRLRVIDNPWFGVKGGREVDALWFLLSPASAWSDRLRPRVRRALPPIWPNYPTGLTRLPPAWVNLLAHFTTWTVLELQPEVDALFRP
ncbi:MAG: patatin-like phospholipase family protein [Myxococcales bacterium]|nr:patatin-like phospholipase family protein [Myxococcales bacterium]